MAIKAEIVVDVSEKLARIPRSMYGVFFEEISHAGDGGLYAEMIRNRSFEDHVPPPGCKVVDGRLVAGAGPCYTTGKSRHYSEPWNNTGDWPGWDAQVGSGSEALFSIGSEMPLSAKVPHYLRAEVRSVAGGRVAMVNRGYWGVAVVKDATYRLRFFARSEGYAGPVIARIESAGGTVIASHAFDISGSQWREYRCELAASQTDARASLALVFESTGVVCVDFVSLQPAATFKNRENGCRADIAQLIADLKPAFVRFPGGCFVEGETIEARHNWYNSVGPVHERPGTYSVWGYWSTNGLGYHEFLEFCEDIGADGLFVANCGLSCEWRNGTAVESDAMQGIIQETLDALEYALGPVNSRYGAMRAAAGHPAPLPLKYLEIGNENWGPEYAWRHAMVAAAVKKRYPQIKLIVNADPRMGEQDFAAAEPWDIADEHWYQSYAWTLSQTGRYDQVTRKPGKELYLGEFAITQGFGRKPSPGGGNLKCAIGEAAMMLAYERTADLITMCSYAPLLVNMNWVSWGTNMIGLDASSAWGHAAYHGFRMLSTSRPDVNVAVSVKTVGEPMEDSAIRGGFCLFVWQGQAEFRDVKLVRDGRTIYAADTMAKAANISGDWTYDAGVWSGVSAPAGGAMAHFAEQEQCMEDCDLMFSCRSPGCGDLIIPIGGTSSVRHGIVKLLSGGGKYVLVEGLSDDRLISRRPATGDWEVVRIEVRGSQMRVFLNGELMTQQVRPAMKRVHVNAGVDEATGQTIVRIINAHEQPVEVSLKGVAETCGSMESLTCDDAEAENARQIQDRVKPIGRSINCRGFSIPANSLNVIRIPVQR